MKLTFTSFLLLCVLLLSGINAQSQTAGTPASDSLRVIEIIQGKNLREKKIDSVTTIETIAGNVILREGLTTFTCDSAAINPRTNIMEAYGNIHINQNDSIHTYSQYLRYIGNDRVAFLKKDVRLTDNKGILYTQDLEYDLKTSIGKYQTGGRVVNGKTVLTSTEGIYYADTKDVYFKKNVHLVDPKHDIISDSLLYNTQTQLATFIASTSIKSKNGGDIYTTNGNYDLKNGKAFFGSRSIIKDSTRTYVADVSAYDEKSGIAQLEGNAIIRDSANGYTVLGGQLYLNKNDNSFLATRKPVLIFKGEGNDSTFIAADTLFSGVERKDTSLKKRISQTDTLHADSVINIEGKPGIHTNVARNKMVTNNQPPKDDAIATNAVPSKEIDSAPSFEDTATVRIDSTSTATRPSITEQSADTITRVDTTLSKNTSKKSFVKNDSPANKNTLRNPGDTIRYFIAFHHVRIFNDSLQSVCDSLFYSSEDSIFRLYQHPLVFSNKSQIAGDTIYLYTKNKKAERIYVFENSILINQANERMYNQLAGRTLNGYFKNGELDYVRAKGSPAESVFYPQDEDSAYTGMNRSKGDLIDIYFINKEVNKVKFVNNVDGTLYPIRQIPEDQKFLKNYKWLDSRRPKNKLELFD